MIPFTLIPSTLAQIKTHFSSVYVNKSLCNHTILCKETRIEIDSLNPNAPKLVAFYLTIDDCLLICSVWNIYFCIFPIEKVMIVEIWIKIYNCSFSFLLLFIAFQYVLEKETSSSLGLPLLFFIGLHSSDLYRILKGICYSFFYYDRKLKILEVVNMFIRL